MRFRRYRLRTIHVGLLDRHMAEAQTIARAMAAGARWVRIRRSERIVDDSGRGVWEIVVALRRRRA